MTLAEPQNGLLPSAFRPLRLETLIWLRWLAVGGQTVAVLVVEFALGYPTPLGPCLALIALSAGVNLFLLLRFGAGDRPPLASAAVQLAYDCLQLAGLLALTGGLQNPFSLLLLAPVSVSATTLPQRATFILAGLAIILASLLSVFHLDLPWEPDRTLEFDRVYVIGIWVSIVCGTVFIAAYTNRVAHESRQLSDALAATELALSRHEQLSALDGLAAAAAHELGTPLSTILLAAREIRDEVPEGPVREDIELIMSQATRCREILVKLRSLRDTPGDPFAAVPVGALLAELSKPLEEGPKVISIRTDLSAGDEPVIRRNAGLLYGLGNLIENAAQFAEATVLIEAGWDKAVLTVTITDDGPGFPPELIARLGEPYLTTRARNAEGGAEPGGLGLGIFIAKTLLERTGARLHFENEQLDRHARVRIAWPRAAIEAA
jgi:two-component system sensor histidine kinase RegB